MFVLWGSERKNKENFDDIHKFFATKLLKSIKFISFEQILLQIPNLIVYLRCSISLLRVLE